MKENYSNLIEIIFPDGYKINVPEGTSLIELAENEQKNFISKIVAAKVNNILRELTFPLHNSCRVKFIDLTDSDGLLIYSRSLCFLLIKAVNDLYPKHELSINHTISKGLFCEIKDLTLTENTVQKIERRMRKLVRDKIPFIKKVLPLKEAMELFKKKGRMDRFHAIEHRKKPYATIYDCGGLEDYFYGYMVPHTGYLNIFALKHYRHGFIIMFPRKSNPDILPEYKNQDRVFNILEENKRWGKILGVENVGALNDKVADKLIYDLIKVNEALHEKKVANIADMISSKHPKKRIILISGPSSSGKTTFAQRLSIQLRVNGLKPVIVSLDDYFVDREQTPLDENGEYDFEALEAIDLELFNLHLIDLIAEKKVNMPIFNFHTGCREKNKFRTLKINEDHLLIIEGIHALNKKLTASVPDEIKFKIFASVLTSLNIDDHNRIPTTDMRMIRRIARDFQFRGSDALSTIRRWPSVRRGEEKNILPFQSEADVMFNSSLIYELGVLKSHVETLLAEITPEYTEFSEAKRLIEFLSYFLPIDSKKVPLNSILREFIGGSCFQM